jgi:hypothetical protein
VGEAVYKARGGVIRVALDSDDKIKKIKITGDFFIFPEDSIVALEKALVGTSAEEGELLKVVKGFYENIDAYEIMPEDIVTAIKKAM